MSLNQSKNVFKQIFIDYWAEFLEMNREYQAEYYDTVIKKMLGCGDPENGFISYRCLQCGEVKRVPFSCKSSFCRDFRGLDSMVFMLPVEPPG